MSGKRSGSPSFSLPYLKDRQASILTDSADSNTITFRFPQKARLKFNHEILKQLSRIQITAAHGEGRRMRKIVGFDHEWKPCRGKQPEEWGRPGSASFPTAQLEDESESSTGSKLRK